MKNGFTLLEVIIVIGILVLLAVISVPVGYNFYRLSLFTQTSDQVIWLLKQAQSNALNQKNNSAFGVYTENKQLTLYQGANYLDRQIGEDSIVSCPGVMKISGLAEINFAKGSGLPDQTGTITLILDSYKKDIKINSQGLITY